jgi:four helix bundle protein
MDWMSRKPTPSHCDLEVYQLAFNAAMQIFELSKTFPVEEKFALTDQIRRSSRSLCGNLAKAWQKRHFKAVFTAKLGDCEAEAAETQCWIEFAVKCHYLQPEIARELYRTYNHILSILISMSNHSSV